MNSDERGPWAERLVGHVRILAPLLLVAAAVLVYSNSFSGTFVFDDLPRIVENPDIRLFPGCVQNTSRPVVQLSFFVNYALDGLKPAGFHLVNLGIHLGAGLLLFALLRLILRHTWRSGSPGEISVAAFGVALAWIVHPLHTESVTYIVQRAEALFSLFYLGTLYAALRSADARRPRAWWALAILLCAAGMATKPIMLTAPVAALLIDSTVVSGSLRRALRKRATLYTGLVATWGILLLLLLTANDSAQSAGPGAHLVSPGRYLLTQLHVIAHYLRLAAWPHPLCIDHAWGDPPLRQLIAPGLITGGLLAASTWATARRHPMGLCGALFFLILSPSSSIIPLADRFAEHRLYLAAAGPIAFAVLGAGALVRRVRNTRARAALGGAGVIALLLVAGLWGTLTHSRNQVYASKERMWRSVVATYPENHRAYINLSHALLRQGRYGEVGTLSESVLTRLPDLEAMDSAELDRRSVSDGGFRFSLQRLVYAHALNNLGIVDMERGFPESAADRLREAVRVVPDLAAAHRNLGLAYYRSGKRPLAIAEWKRALELDPHNAAAADHLAQMLLSEGRDGEAEDVLKRFGKGADTPPAK